MRGRVLQTDATTEQNHATFPGSTNDTRSGERIAWLD
jgi:hypothetical protein